MRVVYSSTSPPKLDPCGNDRQVTGPMISLKACCGLLVGKNDDDHDYEDEGEPLPKPQSTAEQLKNLRGSMSMSLSSDAEGIPEALETSMSMSANGTLKGDAPLHSTRSKGRMSEPPPRDRSFLSSTPKTHRIQSEGRTRYKRMGERHQQRENGMVGPIPEAGNLGAGGAAAAPGGGGGGGSSMQVTRTPGRQGHARASTRSFASPSPSSVSREGVSGPRRKGMMGSAERGGSMRRLGYSPSVSTAGGPVARTLSGGSGAAMSFPSTATGSTPTPSFPKGRGTASSGFERVSSGEKSTPIQAPFKFDLTAFVAKLERGVLLTKINRHGKAKVRTLFYDVQTKVLWWSDPGAAARGTARHRPSSLLSLRKEQPLPVATLLEVRMASQLDAPFCFQGDVDKSFQLVFPMRTVDLVAKDEEEATLLAKGFQLASKEGLSGWTDEGLVTPRVVETPPGESVPGGGVAEEGKVKEEAGGEERSGLAPFTPDHGTRRNGGAPMVVMT